MKGATPGAPALLLSERASHTAGLRRRSPPCGRGPVGGESIACRGRALRTGSEGGSGTRTRGPAGTGGGARRCIVGFRQEARRAPGEAGGGGGGGGEEAAAGRRRRRRRCSGLAPRGSSGAGRGGEGRAGRRRSGLSERARPSPLSLRPRRRARPQPRPLTGRHGRGGGGGRSRARPAGTRLLPARRSRPRGSLGPAAGPRR